MKGNGYEPRDGEYWAGEINDPYWEVNEMYDDAYWDYQDDVCLNPHHDDYYDDEYDDYNGYEDDYYGFEDEYYEDEDEDYD